MIKRSVDKLSKMKKLTNNPFSLPKTTEMMLLHHEQKKQEFKMNEKLA